MPEIQQQVGWFPSELGEDIVVDSHGRSVSGVLGRFRIHKTLDVLASKEADDYRYKEAIVCDQKVRGEDDISTEHLRAENYKRLISRFPKAWDAFDHKDMDAEDGTPLHKLELSEEKIMAFWCEGVRNLEELAHLPDPVCEKLGFGTKGIRSRAEEYLKDREAAQTPKPAKRKPSKSVQAILDRDGLAVAGE